MATTGTHPPAVSIVEVGPRDGLQDETLVLSTEQKLAYIAAVRRAGVRRMEVVSFARPDRVPQMADAEQVLAGLDDPQDGYIGLVLNQRGLQRALQTALGEINVVVLASDSFSQRNQGMSTEAARDMAAEVLTGARQAGLRTGAVVSAAFGCPYEGEIDPHRVIALAAALADAGAHEISLADTIGCAVPVDVEALCREVRAAIDVPLRIHLHNSRSTGLANVIAAISGGVTAIDASTGGIGGCPFAAGATGNIATEDLAYMLSRSGIETGVDLPRLLEAVELLESTLGRTTPGSLAKAGLFPVDRTDRV